MADMEMVERRRLRNAQRRVNKVRNFPVNTCPASRHVHMMADALAAGRKYHMFDEEPEHCAETLYAVLESLWKLRTKHPKTEAEREREQRRVAKAMSAILKEE